jgi:hypothetical protein
MAQIGTAQQPKEEAARARGDNTPQSIRPLRGWLDDLAARDTRDGVGAKMGLDATKSLAASEMTFKRIRVPGEEQVDVAALLAAPGGANWREAVKRKRGRRSGAPLRPDGLFARDSLEKNCAPQC